MTFEFFPELSQNLSQLIDDAYDHDIIINVGENSNTKEFHAHSNVLKARSTYFKTALSQNWAIKENDTYRFTKSNISPIVFEIIIRYMYTGILDLRKHVGSNILELLVASNELLIEELTAFIQNYLIENQSEWLRNNFVKVLNIVYIFENCKQLQNYCLEFICEDPEPFFDSPEFPSLEKNILLELLKRDDLLIDEIELWNYLIKWGIVQTSELREKNITDLNKWNEGDFLNLKNTLNPLILHIRFFDIFSEDFYSKIWPFKKVLPEMLFEEVVSFHLADIKPEKNMVPPRHKKIYIDSMVIKPKHATIFINWIQRKDANARISKDKYNFNLIYRGSRDGFDVNTMINKCNGQGACILVIKIKENGTLIGGYNPLGWNYRSYHVGGIYNSYDMYGGLYGYGGIYGSGGLYGGYYGGYSGLYGNSLNRWANTTESFIFLWMMVKI
uniref:Btb/poz domain-containing protein 19-like n=1 Tax=Rhizophagus irregularis (strain DAOM 181602 / DAOM 197198 / MUCL 43194) TaxID=747089 RepID=U9U508_RHIID